MSIVTGRKLNRFFNQIKDVFSNKSIYNNTSINLGRMSGTTVGNYSAVVGGQSNTASAVFSAVVGGSNNTASGASSTVFGGSNNTASASSTVVGGQNNTSSASSSVVVGGGNNTADKLMATVVGGSNNTASAYRSGIFAGYNSEVTVNSDDSAIVGGSNNTMNSSYSAIVGGSYNTADAFSSAIIAGYYCISQYNAVMMGHYNDTTKGTAATSASGTGTGTALEIGNGTSSANSNAIRGDYNGKLWCKSSYSSTGADYAELFEWQDGNPNNEDRRGYFVTMVGNKIKKANPSDWILGIVSANPCILGNSDMEWQGQFMRDEFGAFIIEDTIVTETRQHPKLDEDGNQVYKEVPIVDGAGNQLFDKDGNPAFTLQPVFEDIEVEVPCQFYKVNPDYDPDQEYIDRISRPEWDAIGMIGVLSVYDDGTCRGDGFCTVADGGIATASDYGYRVIERVADNIVKVVINTESSNMVLALMNKIALPEQQINQLQNN